MRQTKLDREVFLSLNIYSNYLIERKKVTYVFRFLYVFDVKRQNKA